MQQLSFYLALFLFSICNFTVGQIPKTVDPFDKVIVSPHIQVSFIEGNEETVSIVKNTEPDEKLNIEVKNKTLRIYLDDAKEIAKKEKVIIKGRETKKSIYTGTVVNAIITYKTLKELSLRGEEIIVCKSPLKVDKFRLKIYGQSKVTFNEVQFKRLRTSIYGESILNIKSGEINEQKISAYGESKVNALEVLTQTTKLTAFGDSDFNVMATDEIRITAYGEASLKYKGSPEIKKSLSIGDLQIIKME